MNEAKIEVQTKKHSAISDRTTGDLPSYSPQSKKGRDL